MTGEEILERACAEVIAAIRLGRRIDRLIPTSALSKAFTVAIEEAATLLPEETLHSGLVWELAS